MKTTLASVFHHAAAHTTASPVLQPEAARCMLRHPGRLRHGRRRPRTWRWRRPRTRHHAAQDPL